MYLTLLFFFKGYIGSHSRFHRGLYKRLKRYLYDFWNAIDLLSYVLLVIALFVRHLPYAIEHNIARRTFSLSLLVMYVRFLEVFLVNRNLGPTLIMVKEMVKYSKMCINVVFDCFFKFYSVWAIFQPCDGSIKTTINAEIDSCLTTQFCRLSALMDTYDCTFQCLWLFNYDGKFLPLLLYTRKIMSTCIIIMLSCHLILSTCEIIIITFNQSNVAHQKR